MAHTEKTLFIQQIFNYALEEKKIVTSKDSKLKQYKHKIMFICVDLKQRSSVDAMVGGL